MVLILVPTLTFSQYPKTKKIGQDSVVIITIGQADTINNLYRSYHDSINNLQFKLKKNDSLLSVRTIEKDSFYNWKYKYSINKSLYQDFEQNQRKIDKIHAASKLMLIFIIILQFSQLQ
ncbi:MAG: hypothetical protein RL158_1007 [Bacteroidota bacterium]